MSEHFTKTRIFDAAEELLLGKSFQAVSLNEILKSTGTPKGCFYHHFDSKEAFGVELIKHYVDDTIQSKSALLLNAELEPNARLRILSLFESSIAQLIENGGQCPCLLIKLASETGFASPLMREQMSLGHNRINKLYSRVILEGQENGYISKERSAGTTADILMAIWLGAVNHALFHQKVDILRTALNFITTELLPPPQSKL